MDKRIQPTPVAAPKVPGFGERLVAARKAAGFTQVGFAAELGVSQRLVAYYESPTAAPPTHLLPAIALAVGMSIDDLYGLDAPEKPLDKQEDDSKMYQRLLAIEEPDIAEMRQALQLIDASIERGQLKHKMESRA